MAELEIHANLAVAAGAVFIPVCTSCVGLRIYVRRLHRVALGTDDWTVIAALVFVVAMGITLIAEVGTKQLGYPAPDPSTAIGRPNANIALWPIEILQIPALGLVKASFCLLYQRIFTKSHARIFNRITWLMLFVVISWTLSFFFSMVFICGTNFSAYWTSTTIEKLVCVDTSMLHNAFAISDVVTDVIIIILPLPMVWKLHLTMRRKLGVCAIFGLGAFSVAASIVRMAIYIQATSKNYDPNADFEFLCTSGAYWSMIESGLGLCAACLPVQYGLMKSKGVQSIVRSFQSAMSLRSTSSSGQDDVQITKISRHHSQDAIICNAEGPARDSHTLEKGISPEEHQIIVTHRLEQA